MDLLGWDPDDIVKKLPIIWTLEKTHNTIFRMKNYGACFVNMVRMVVCHVNVLVLIPIFTDRGKNIQQKLEKISKLKNVQI